MAQPSAYQRVSSEYDITEAGVTSLDYLSFDGSDDGMATASIDFTSTDEMSVFAGVRKKTDTSVDMVAALGDYANNTGSFFLTAVNSTSKYSSASRGGAATNSNQFADTTSSAYNAPHTGVISTTHDISGDSTILRINGTQVDEATGDTGAGNFGNYAISIGAFNVDSTASLFFNGNLYGLIVRGASSTATEISNTETYLANRSGVSI